jgi:predicted AlkP superfamily pyrophosphatase or phosphodiesterase
MMILAHGFPRKIFLFVLFVLIIKSCEWEVILPGDYETKNVIVVVVDGARYSETWGDDTHQYVPRMSNQLSKKGTIYTQFYNDGPTYTNAGHTAISTGNYQEINNGGTELPEYPSFLQHWLQANQKDSMAAWVVSSKDKLEVLSDCHEPNWKGRNNPATNCGNNGLGTGYRHDSLTFKNIIEVLSNHKPNLMLVNFREPDYSAHQGEWEGYTKGIADTDEYIYKIWRFIENDPFYKGTTAMFVTNDHGRHLEGIGNGYTSHGDGCEGCRHINLFACGPDFKKDCIIETKRGLTDIPETISELLNFHMPNSNGEVMYELFK